MRRAAIITVVVALACSPGEQTASDTTDTLAAPAPASLSDYAGTWQGPVTAADGGDAVANLELTAAADPANWSMTVVNATDASRTTTAPVRASLSGDTLILESGPFASVLREGAQVSTHSIYRLEGGRLVGTVHVTYANGDTVMLRSEATRR